MRWSSWMVVALAGTLACAESDPMPFEELRGEGIYLPAVLAGGGESDLVVWGAWDGSGHTRFRVLRHDPSRPDALVEEGRFEVATSRVDRLAVTGTRAAFASGAAVVVADLGTSPVATETVALPFVPDHVLAEGSWLLAAAGAQLELVELDGAGRATFLAPAAVTALAAAQHGFLAFTEGGYVRVEPGAAARFTATTSAEVWGFRRVFPDGAEAIAAGPARGAGRLRVVRLDLRDPGAPAVLKEAEVEGAYGAFAWDGDATAVLEVQGEPGAGLYEGYVVRELASGFEATRVPTPLWWQGGEDHVAAHADRLFVLHGPTNTLGADYRFSIYRIR